MADVDLMNHAHDSPKHAQYAMHVAMNPKTVRCDAELISNLMKAGGDPYPVRECTHVDSLNASKYWSPDDYCPFLVAVQMCDLSVVKMMLTFKPRPKVFFSFWNVPLQALLARFDKIDKGNYPASYRLSVKEMTNDLNYQKLVTLQQPSSRAGFTELAGSLLSGTDRTFEARAYLLKIFLGHGVKPESLLSKCTGPNYQRFLTLLLEAPSKPGTSKPGPAELGNLLAALYQHRGHPLDKTFQPFQNHRLHLLFWTKINELLQRGANPSIGLRVRKYDFRVKATGMRPRTALSAAAESGHVGMVKLLLKWGAIPYAESRGYRRALLPGPLGRALLSLEEMSAWYKERKVAMPPNFRARRLWTIKVLLKSGINANVWVRGINSFRPLHLAMSRDFDDETRLALVRLLIKYGAQPNARDGSGANVLDWLRIVKVQPYDAIASILKRAGGQLTSQKRLVRLHDASIAREAENERQVERDRRENEARMNRMAAREEADRQAKERRRELKEQEKQAAWERRSREIDQKHRREREAHKAKQGNAFANRLAAQQAETKRYNDMTAKAVRDTERAQRMRAAQVADQRRAREQADRNRAASAARGKQAQEERRRQEQADEQRRRKEAKTEQWRRQEEARKAKVTAETSHLPSRGSASGRSSAADGRTGGEGINRATTSRACAAVRAAWGGGPSMSYTPSAAKPAKTIRIKGQAKQSLAGYTTQKAACDRSAEKAHESLKRYECKRDRGGQWDGRPYDLIECFDCKKVSGGTEWQCGARISIGCVVTPKSDMELKMRRKILLRLLANAIPTVDSTITEFQNQRGRLPTTMPGESFIGILEPLMNFKRKAPAFRGKIARAANITSLDSLYQQISGNIRSIGRQIQSCR